MNTQAFDPSNLSTFKNRSECKIQKDFLYLTKKQFKKITETLQDPNPQRIIRRYDVSCPNGKSRAYILNDKIRTHFQKVLVLISKNKIREIEIVKFDEPIKYKAPRKWLNFIFKNKDVDSLNVDAISGATLTTNSILRIVKKAKELDRL